MRGKRERAGGFQGIGAVTQQGLCDGQDDQVKRIFPAAALAREDPAVADMHPGCAEEDRQQGKRHPAALNAEHEQDTADELGPKVA